MKFTGFSQRVFEQDLITAVIVVFFILFGVVAALLPLDDLAIRVLIDDALYYPEIARNIVAGQGVTFDGSTITNGFHPLWMLINIPVAWVSPTVELNVRLLLVASGIIAATAFYFLSRFLHEIERSQLIMVSLAFVAFWPLALWFGLIEASLSLLMISLLLHWSVKKNLLDLPTSRRAFVLGSVLALMCLARLDFVFIAIAAFSAIGLRKIVRQQVDGEVLKRFGIALATFVVITGVYLLWNLIVFGGFIPVSGAKKIELIWSSTNLLTFAAISIPAIIDNPRGVVFVFGGVILMIASGIAAYRSRTLALDKTVRSVLEVIIVGIILRHLVLRLIIPESATTIWHLVPEYLLVTLVMAILLSMTIRLSSQHRFCQNSELNLEFCH